MAKKWRRLTMPIMRSSSPSRDQADENSCSTSSSSMAEKGYFVVYTSDWRRLMLPLAYLNSGMFRELLRLAEEELGLPSNGPLSLPFDAVFLEYVISLNRRNEAHDDVLEKALITSIATGRCLS